MAIPNLNNATSPVNYDYAFVPTTGVDFPGGVCRALWISHNAATTFTVILANGDSVVIPIQGGAVFLPLRVKQISANAGAVLIVALF